MQLFKSQMKEDVEMNDKTEIKTDKISYKKYYRHMGILGTLGGAMWIFYWVMEKVLPAIKKGHTLTNVINLVVVSNTISTHTLTWSVTANIGIIFINMMHFNSHAHVERDL